MKAHRFVRFLGEQAEQTGEELDVLASPGSHQASLVGYDGDGRPPGFVVQTFARDIAERLNGHERGDVRFSVQTLSDEANPPGTPPPADLAILFHARLPEYSVAKGVLVQGLGLTSPEGESSSEWPPQIDGMTTHSPASFVFVYQVEGTLRVVPAAAVRALADSDGLRSTTTLLKQLYSKRLGRFFEEFAECFIGDPDLVGGLAETAEGDETEMLRGLLADLPVPQLLYLGIASASDAVDARLDHFG